MEDLNKYFKEHEEGQNSHNIEEIAIVTNRFWYGPHKDGDFCDTTLIINKDGSFKYAEGLLKELIDFDDIYSDEDEYEFVNSEDTSIISSESEGKIENSDITECFHMIHEIVNQDTDAIYASDCGEYSIYIKYENGEIRIKSGCLIEPIEYNNVYMQYYLKKITGVYELKCLSLGEY